MSIPAEAVVVVRSVVGTPADSLGDLPIHRLLNLRQTQPEADAGAPVKLQSVANPLAEAIGRLHHAEPLDHLLMRT